MKARNIEIEFHAFEYAAVTRGSGKHRHTYIEHRDIIKQIASLWSCAEGETLGPCSKEFPFELTIPENALRSLYTPFDFMLPEYARDIGIRRTIRDYPYTGTIRYRLKVKLDKPMAIDPKDKTFLDVLPLPVQGIEKTWQEYEEIAPSGETGIFASILGNTFTPGERIQGTFKVVRDSTVDIRSISATLRFKYSYTAKRRTDMFKQRIDYHSWPDNPGAREMSFDISLIVPEGIPFSVDGHLVKIAWELDIKLDLPMKRDKHLRIPITIGPKG